MCMYKSTFAILFLWQVSIAILNYNNCWEHYLFYRKTKDFHKALVFMIFSVEIRFESYIVAVIFDEVSTC